MLRPLLFTLAVLALVNPPSAPAAAPKLQGNWILANVRPTGETAVCLLKFEMKDGKLTASPAFTFPSETITVSDVRVSDSSVAVTVKRVRNFGERDFTEILQFVGVPGKDPKVVFGSVGNERFRQRMKLIATDREKLKNLDEVIKATPLPEPMTKLNQMNAKVGQAQRKYLAEKDAGKKKELLKEVNDAFREANEKSPELYREVVAKNADSPAAFDAATALLRGAARNKLTADEAEKCVKIVQDNALPYGPLFAATTLPPIADALARQPGLEAIALRAIEPAAKAITDDQPATLQSIVLSSYQNALIKAGKTAEAKELGGRIAKLETRLDAEYLKTVPPFKPTMFAGRKDKEANRVVMMELFTGAQCPPCVAADVAFDALQKSYKPTELVLVQYHMHIPGSDPMTNPDTIARWDYYRKHFPTGIRGVPTSLFNGKPETGGGGGMTASEKKFEQYSKVINPLLENTTTVKLAGKAKQSLDNLEIAVEVANGDGDDMKLRLLVVEEAVRYAGSNGIRFHHHVVRAMPGGADGIAVKDKVFKHSATVNVAEIRKGLMKYLDGYVAENPNRPFARPDRPMEMKNIHVIALVQNDKTGEIVQAVQIELEGKPKAAAGID